MSAGSIKSRTWAVGLGLMLATGVPLPGVSSAQAASDVAVAPAAADVRVNGVTVPMQRDDAKGLWISTPCGDGCAARTALDRATLRGTLPSPGGRHPGAAVCHAQGGVDALGIDARGGEVGLCRFGDGSLVSDGSLHVHALKRDAASAPR